MTMEWGVEVQISAFSPRHQMKVSDQFHALPPPAHRESLFVYGIEGPVTSTVGLNVVGKEKKVSAGNKTPPAKPATNHTESSRAPLNLCRPAISNYRHTTFQI